MAEMLERYPLVVSGRFDYNKNAYDSNWKREKISQAIYYPNFFSEVDNYFKRHDFFVTHTTEQKLTSGDYYVFVGYLEKKIFDSGAYAYSLNSFLTLKDNQDIAHLFVDYLSKDQETMLSDYIKDKDPLRVLHTLFFEDPLPFDEALSRQLTLARNNNNYIQLNIWAEELQDLIPGKKTAIRLLKHYGANLKDDLKDNPWILYIDEKADLDFCDTIAKKCTNVDYTKRDEAICLRTVVTYLRNSNDTYVPNAITPALLQLSQLDVQDMDSFEDAILSTSYVLKKDFGLQPTFFHHLEKSLLELKEKEKEITTTVSLDNILSDGIDYTKEQEDAIKLSLLTDTMYLTGGPGTGKSFVTNAIIKANKAYHGYRDSDIILLAPTGKAANRLSEATNLPTKTIHSYFGLPAGHPLDYFRNNEGFLDNLIMTTASQKPKMLIVDEASMLDILTGGLIARFCNFHNVKLIMVGDVNQLPSIANGQVFKDLLNHSQNVITLSRVMRQKDDSNIPILAETIQEGLFPSQDAFATIDDINFVPADDNYVLTILNYLADNKDVMPNVLTPYVNKGLGHTVDTAPYLNHYIQQRLHPDADQFAIGDPVICKSNSFHQDLRNGSVLTVCDLTYEDDNLTEIELSSDQLDHNITVKSDEFQNFTLGYAITIHKSQGSEYDEVLIPLLRNTRFVTRNLLYTAVTRAKTKLHLIGSYAAFRDACLREEEDRHTGLNVGS